MTDDNFLHNSHLHLLRSRQQCSATQTLSNFCSTARRIWSICAFDQMRGTSGKCAFDQSPNHDSNPNLNTNPVPNPNPNPNRNHIANPNPTLNLTSTKCRACMQVG